MKKKIIAAALAAAMLMPTGALAESATTYIEIPLGESYIVIDGMETETEPSYTVGDGVTLVPIRVVTEALGASVNWYDEENKIVVTYQDVRIELTIGSYVAWVNDYAVTIDAAPELAGDTAMVPLRFLAESFDATVSYDEETDTVIIEKGMPGTGTTISTMTQYDRIGDSFFGWSMDTPKDYFSANTAMVKDYIVFSNSNTGATICIEIYDRDDLDMTDINQIYLELKEGFYGTYATVSSELRTEYGADCMEFELMTTSGHDYEKYYFTDEHIYSISAMVGYDVSTDDRQLLKALFDSFRPEYIGGEDIYDMSNVEDGTRLYEHTGSKTSMRVPTKWQTGSLYSYYYSSSSLNNSYSLSSADDSGTISMTIWYDAERSAAEYAAESLNARRDAENAEVSTSSNIYTTEVADGLTAYCYDVAIDYTSAELGEEYKRTDAYFKNGDYIYHLRIFTTAADEETVESVLSTLTSEELYVEDFGAIQQDAYTDEYTFTYELDGVTVSLNSFWKQYYYEYLFMNVTNGSALVVYSMDLPGELEDLENDKIGEALEELLTDSATDGVEIIEEMHTVTVNGVDYYVVGIKDTSGYETAYNKTYITVNGDKLYMFDYIVDEEYYNDSAKSFLDEVVEGAVYTED